MQSREINSKDTSFNLQRQAINSPLSTYKNIFESMIELLNQMAESTENGTLTFYTKVQIEMPIERPYPYYLIEEHADFEVINTPVKLTAKHVNAFKEEFDSLMESSNNYPSLIRIKMFLNEFFERDFKSIASSYSWRDTVSSYALSFFSNQQALDRQGLIAEIQKKTKDIENDLLKIQQPLNKNTI